MCREIHSSSSTGISGNLLTDSLPPRSQSLTFADQYYWREMGWERSPVTLGALSSPSSWLRRKAKLQSTDWWQRHRELVTAKHGSPSRLPGPPSVFEQLLENPGSLRPQRYNTKGFPLWSLVWKQIQSLGIPGWEWRERYVLPGVWFLYLHDFSFWGLSLPAGTCFALSELKAAMNEAFILDFSTSFLVSPLALCGAFHKDQQNPWGMMAFLVLSLSHVVEMSLSC